MGSAIGIVLVLFLVMTVYSLILGGRMRTSVESQPTRIGLKSVQSGTTFTAFTEGLVALFAVVHLVGGGFDVLASLFLGAVVAGVAAMGLLFNGFGRLVVQVVFSFVGLAAVVPALTALFADDACGGAVDPTFRTGVIAALLIVWALSLTAGMFGARLSSLFVGRFVSRWNASAGLALFGAIDVIVLAASPVGLGLPTAALNTIFWGVAVVGLLTGVFPELVLLTCGLALGVLSLASMFMPMPSGCENVGSIVPFAMTVGYLLCYWAIVRVMLRRARS
jgi:hypothetical protein